MDAMVQLNCMSPMQPLQDSGDDDDESEDEAASAAAVGDMEVEAEASSEAEDSPADAVGDMQVEAEATNEAEDSPADSERTLKLGELMSSAELSELTPEPKKTSPVDGIPGLEPYEPGISADSYSSPLKSCTDEAASDPPSSCLTKRALHAASSTSSAEDEKVIAEPPAPLRRSLQFNASLTSNASSDEGLQFRPPVPGFHQEATESSAEFAGPSANTVVYEAPAEVEQSPDSESEDSDFEDEAMEESSEDMISEDDTPTPGPKKPNVVDAAFQTMQTPPAKEKVWMKNVAVLPTPEAVPMQHGKKRKGHDQSDKNAKAKASFKVNKSRKQRATPPKEVEPPKEGAKMYGQYCLDDIPREAWPTGEVRRQALLYHQDRRCNHRSACEKASFFC